MSSTALSALFGLTTLIPFICTVTLAWNQTFAISKNISLTFYQIKRLQNTFSADSLNNKILFQRYGYSQRTFILLYAFGILVMSMFAYTGSLLPEPIELEGVGCKWAALTTMSKQLKLFEMISSAIYYIWDVTVLLLYILRAFQIRKYAKSDINSTVYKKADATVTKIIFLTLCYEVISMLIAVGFAMNCHDLCFHILQALAVLNPVLVIFFMAEHNDNKYQKCIEMFEHILSGCCCLAETESDDSDNDKTKTKTDTIGLVDTVNRMSGHSIVVEEDPNAEKPQNNPLSIVMKSLSSSEKKHVCLCFCCFTAQLFVFLVVLFILVLHCV